MSSIHRLGRGLPGYLILFDPHAFVPQCQYTRSKLPSQLVFYVISKHFPLHDIFRLPPDDSGSIVSMAVSELSSEISPLTYRPTYAPFKPSESG